MSHAIASNVDQAADAIVALINSRPSSPTKAEIAAAIALAQAPALEPTELGRELLARIPAYAAAVAKDGASNGQLYTAGDEQVADIDATMKIVDAINERPVTSLAQLVDLGIVARFCGSDNVYHTDELDDYQAAQVAIVRFLLQAAGIEEASCSITNPAFRA